MTTTLIHADVILEVAQKDIPIQVRVNDVIQVRLPLKQMEWQVSYTADLLVPVMPPDRMRNPGADGWFFRAIAPGISNIMLTSIPQPCPTQTPCPSTAARWIFIIDAHK